MTSDRCHCVPKKLWPQEDRTLWDCGLNRSTLLDLDAVAAKWRPRTIQTVMEAYGYAVHWLRRERLVDDRTPPADRWTDPVLQDYIAYLRERVASATVKNRILNLERAIAVMSPQSDRVLLRATINNLPNLPNYTDKRSRLQEPAALVEFGMRLMQRSIDEPVRSVRKNATHYRDGLQIALLAMRTMRKGNFSSINIGQHLVEIGGEWQLLFDDTETKTHEPLEVTVPEVIVPALEHYLDHVRPLLAGSKYTGPALWVSYRYRRQAAHSIQLKIAAQTKNEFGRHVNPHLFRDCAATFIAIDDPEHVRVAAAVLGHRSFATTQRHYNLAQTVDAARCHIDVINRQRMRLLKKGPRRQS